MNRIILNETSYHGAGAVKEITNELAHRGLKKPIVFSDPDLVKFGVTKKVTDILDAAKVKYIGGEETPERQKVYAYFLIEGLERSRNTATGDYSTTANNNTCIAVLY